LGERAPCTDLALGKLECQMVDDRRTAILRAVVQHYIETSQPVSSSAVANASGVGASAATVRGEMAALERDGFLQQPHTSAGRIPTDRGYRFFVDQLEEPGRLGPAQQQDVKDFFTRSQGELEQMLHDAGRLLSDLTGAAAVVVGPDHETTTVKSFQLVLLHARSALAVIVFSNGAVDKRAIDSPDDMSEAVVAAVSARLAAHLKDRSLRSVDDLLPSHNADVDRLTSLVLVALHVANGAGDADNVYVGGASRLAGAFEAVETVRNVLTILEQQYVVVTLIRDLLDRGIMVSIGAENGLTSLAHCSLVVAPTIVDGEQVGSVAVLGPTRMNYSQTLAAVSAVSYRLGRRLGHEA
jgi:heat-inducible transcriptional repressor